MELREVLVFAHTLGVAGWIGGGLFGVFAVGKLAQSGGQGVGDALENLFEKAGAYFTVMFVLVVGSGVTLVFTEEQWTWGDTFVWVGIGGIILSGAVQGLIAAKKDRALVESVKADGPDRANTLASWRKTSWIDAAILIAVLWAMVVKLGS